MSNLSTRELLWYLKNAYDLNAFLILEFQDDLQSVYGFSLNRAENIIDTLTSDGILEKVGPGHLRIKEGWILATVTNLADWKHRHNWKSEGKVGTDDAKVLEFVAPRRR